MIGILSKKEEMMTYPGALAVAALWVLAAACGEDKNEDKNAEGECDPSAVESGCEEGMSCEETKGGVPQCAAPIEIRGKVVDTADGTAIADARVQAVDPNGAAVGTSAVTGADGGFVLVVPGVRDETGAPVDTAYTLRAQAAGYQRFPTGLRQALPLDAASAADVGGIWVIENALSTIGLIRLPGDSTGFGAISGTILSEGCTGVLVVADGGESGLPGYSDGACAYTIFNVPAGSYTVRGYAAGVQLNPADASVAGAEAVVGVDLTAAEVVPGTVSGNIQFVNASGTAATSVILAVESTFDEAVAKGEAPPGLRAGDVTGDFTIEGVPDGQYVVLAAFENDGLVRDPDESIGGTELLRLSMPDAAGNRTIVLPGFKVTGALAVHRPGADKPEPITTSTPILEWEDDSSEDGYAISVTDAFGEELLYDEIPSVSGSATVTYTYGGPAFEAGMYYQFKVLSFREKNQGDRTYISATEDLRGVFYFAP